MKEIIKLAHPVTLDDGSRLEALSMRRPTVGDMIAADISGSANKALSETKLIARLCDVNIEDLRKVDYADYLAAQAVLLRVLGGDASRPA